MDCEDFMYYHVDETRVPVGFSGCCERLPADASAKYAHIIDMSTYKPEDGEELYDVKIQDAIVTLLFKISEDVLKQFLNGGIKSFMFKSKPNSPCMGNIIIERQGNDIMVGDYLEYPKEKLLEWDYLVRCLIDFDGTWEVVEASFGKYTRDLKGARNKDYVRTHVKRGSPTTSTQQMMECAGMMAEQLLQLKCWDPEEECKLEITTT